LLKYESSRSPRERNYKSEAFINKHVIWNQYVRGAKKRGLNFTIGKTLFNTLITEPCFYCGHTNKAEVNGIDRIDNNRGYEEGNIIPCCEICNTAKRSQHPLEFIDKLAAIYEFATSSTPIRSETIEKWKLTYLTRNIPKYTMYLESARKRNIEFCLTNDQFSSIIMSPCYLCGIPSNTIHTNGIDRFNNLKGYTIDNSRACCGHCNIMKGNLLYEDIMRIAKSISSNYSRLVTFFSEISIPVRTSNIMPRIKLDNPICPDIITTTHKPINEVILPNTDSTITDLLIDYNRMKVHQPPKQWKIKQIREAILSGNEHLYKEYCEEHNISAKGNDWDNTWNAFITNVKECTSDDCSKVIQQFICSLRRNRHTELCYAKNAKIVERPDRQKWPSSTIVRAFLDGKISEFKKYIDTNGCDQEKWNEFISSLEDNKHNRGALVQLCSKFLATMRIRRYRCKK
jgi:hypothetical protein